MPVAALLTSSSVIPVLSPKHGPTWVLVYQQGVQWLSKLLVSDQSQHSVFLLQMRVSE